MATVNVTEASFARTIAEHPIVFVDFWAAWCGPCRTFGPVFEKVSAQHPDIVFAKIDTEAEQGLATAAGISSIPTLMAIRDGIVVFSQAGALAEPNLANLVQAVRDVDMDALRASLPGTEVQG
jgi:thioredoxin 1